ncbi:MAG: hypothetical protein AAFW01_19860 [Pseudomonadota bacterium]
MAMEDRKNDAKRAFARAHAGETRKPPPPLTDEQKRYRLALSRFRPGGGMRKQADAMDRAINEQEEARKAREREAEERGKEQHNSVEYGSLSQRFNRRSLTR